MEHWSIKHRILFNFNIYIFNMDSNFCKYSLKNRIFKVIDINDKVYDFDINKIYLDDNINTVIDKISSYCIQNTKREDVYIWYLDNDDNIKSLCFNYKININISQPLIDSIDENFLDENNNFSKIDIKFNNNLINSILDLKNDTLYFITIDEYIKTIGKIGGKIDDKIKNSIIKKYWPLQKDDALNKKIKGHIYNKTEIKDINKNKKCLEKIDEQIDMINDVFDDNDMCNGLKFRFIKINNLSVNNEVDILKLFANINTSIDEPFTKLYLNNYEESYYKLYKAYYINKYIDTDTLLSWIKGKYIIINDVIYYFTYKNSFTIIKKIDDIFIQLIIEINGNVSIVIENIDINIDKLNKIIDICNLYIKTNINNNNIYSIYDLLPIDFKWSERYLHNKNIELFNYTLQFDKINFDKINFEEYTKLLINLISYTRDIKEYDHIKRDNLYLRFIRIDNYNNTDVGQIIYNKFKKENLSDINIKKIIKTELLINDADIDDRMDIYISNYEKRKYKRNIESGPEIIINIDNIHLNVIVNDVKTIDEYYRILKFILSVNNIYRNKKLSKYNKYFDKNDTFTKYYLKGCILDDGIESIDEDSDNDSEYDDFEIEFEDTEHTDQVDTEHTDQVDQVDTDQNIEENINHLFDGNEESSSETDSSDKQSGSGKHGGSYKQSGSGKQSGGGDLRRYKIKRLDNYDKKLFKWKGKDNDENARPTYVKTCDSTSDRQPIPVTDKQLDIINSSEDRGSGKNSYTNAIKYGSDPNKQYNYICPEYWDTENELSLDKNNPNWDRKKILTKNDDIKNTDKTILHRNSNYWKNTKILDDGNYINIPGNLPAVKELENKNPELNMGVPCCSHNIIKDINVETGVITNAEICYKNYCNLDERLNLYFEQINNIDKVYLKRGIKFHTILDSIIYILNIAKIVDFDKIIIDFNYDDKIIQDFFNMNEIHNKLYLNTNILDYETIKINIIHYFKIKTKDDKLKINILKEELLLSILEKNKNIVFDDFNKNIIRKCINIEKININDTYKICKWTDAKGEHEGLVEHDTGKSYRICCKGNKKYYEKGALWMTSNTIESDEFSCRDKLNTYDITLDNIVDGIKYIDEILINIDEIYNKYIYYIKFISFKNILIDYVKLEDGKYFSECGNGHLVNYFKKYKNDITEKDIQRFIKKYPKYKKYDITKLYLEFNTNIEIYNLFNINTAIDNFINYLDSGNLDDLYMLPIVKSYITQITNGKNIDIIVFENMNNDIRIKNQLFDYNFSKDTHYIFLYKNGINYEPICFKNGKVYTYIYDNKDILKIKTDIQKNIVKGDILDYDTIVDKFKIEKVYIHNNYMTHLITDKNIFIPIKKCFIENSDLICIYDIIDIELVSIDNYKKFYKNPILKDIYEIDKYVIENDKLVNIVFSNMSYVPVLHHKIIPDITIYGYSELFKLDKNISLNNFVENDEYNNAEYINIILDVMEDFIKYMTVEFKNSNKRFENVEDIKTYKSKINQDGLDVYKGEKITKIIINKFENTGTIYTYNDTLDKINTILKNDIDKIQKTNELYKILIHKIDKVIDKLDTDLIRKNKLIDTLLYRFIELLLIYGIDKNYSTNIYNCEKKIELHTLSNTTSKDELFISYNKDIKEYIEYLFDTNIYINKIDN